MYKHEGALSFYKGFLPTIIQAAPYAGRYDIQYHYDVIIKPVNAIKFIVGFAFAFYSSLTRIWRNYLSSSSKNKIGKGFRLIIIFSCE